MHSRAVIPRTPSRPAPALLQRSAAWPLPVAEDDVRGEMDSPATREAAPAIREAALPTRARTADLSARFRLRFGLPAKISVFLAAILIPLALMTWTLSVQALQAKMTEEFTSKGAAIANSLASSGVDLILTRDASTVQALVDQFAAIAGVSYVMVYDTQKTLVAHTFAPVVPGGLIDKNLVPGDTAQQVRELLYPDPVTGATREIIDIGVPMLGGQLGTVRVGMNKAIITTAASRSGQSLLLVFAGFAVLAVLAGVVFARRITQPVAQLVRVSERVGQGDLSRLVSVTSRDEIGQLSATFNDTIVRLRTQVQTEAERDEERKTREELQRQISQFLNTAMEISQGDLTRRGEVTAGVLGSVVDAINVMVTEIEVILRDVRQAAVMVNSSAQDMIGAMGQMTVGARAQSVDAVKVSTTVEELTHSVREVARTAEASAGAAKQGLEAARQGEQAVHASLDGMQRIRAEVQTISKKIKTLGDRSLEISEIINTIDDIAAQTNLLALNAAIEAAGAGEAGLRFAIVADEVRKLAERSAKATKDIAALIKSFQGETQQAVIAMEEGTREVESGYRLTTQAGDSLKQIAEISQRTAGLAQDISHSTQQQVRGVEGVAASVRSIASVAVETEQSVVQTRRTVDDLVRLAQELASTLSRFKIGA